MENSKINVLLAEDNPEGSFFWERIITDITDTDIEFVHIEKLSDVRKHLASETPDIILLDLSLSRTGGLEAFLSVNEMATTIPIIVVTGTDDQKFAVQTALEGAQDCLVKGNINGYWLNRSMRFAIGRQKYLKQLKAFSVVDELTGLYNRRGFLILADQQIKMADRTEQSLLLVFADVDGLKAINDTLGHHRGDLALMETAHVLRESFRETDILGRLSGDEFVALLTCSLDVNEELLLKRFKKTMDEHNSYRERNFKLSVSIGIAPYSPHSSCSAADLLVKADSVMYKQKKKKKEKKNQDDLQVFAEMKDPVRSVLEDTKNETIVRLMIPILRKCGLDPGLSLELSYWVAKGSRELKLNLIGMIEEIGDGSGGSALRMALFDDSEEIATLAARVMGKIHFIPGLPVLLKAAKIRGTRFVENEGFLMVVCRSLGDLAQPEAISFLQDIAGNKLLLKGKNFSLPVRLEAIQALTQINHPETLHFLESLTAEKDPQLQEALEKLIQNPRSVH